MDRSARQEWDALFLLIQFQTAKFLIRLISDKSFKEQGRYEILKLELVFGRTVSFNFVDLHSLRMVPFYTISKSQSEEIKTPLPSLSKTELVGFISPNFVHFVLLRLKLKPCASLMI